MYRATGPIADKGARIGARAIDLAIVLVVSLALVNLTGDPDRPFASVFLVWLVAWGYEIVGILMLGGSLGKRAVGVQVVGLDRVERPDLPVAAKRAAVDATYVAAISLGAYPGILAVPPAAVALWAGSTLADPLGRSAADRAADTMVVPRSASLPVSTPDLPGFADGARPPRVTPLGRIADVDVRARARLRRLVDSPVLAGLLGLLALAGSMPLFAGSDAQGAVGEFSDRQWVMVAAATAIWVVFFSVDETRLVHRHGATVGHELAGTAIVDLSTGAPPSTGRSAARAVVLGLTLYVPPLWPLLLVSLAMMRWSSTGRGLHDLAGRTAVIGDPLLDPETQRQRAMRMRLGRAD